MKIAIDVTPLSDNRILSHRVRGTGFYLQNLKNSLLEFYPDNKYQFFENQEIIENDTEIVHYPYFEPFFITLPIAKKYKRIVTVHDLTPFVFPNHFPAGVRGKINWQIQRMSLGKADAVITDSESSKRDIIKHTGISESKIDVVYLAAGEEFGKLEIGNWKLEITDKYKLPKKFILYVGDVTWNKNLPRLIQAIKEINVPLVMVGAALAEEAFDKTNPWNSDLVEVQKMAKDNKNIIRLGFVPTDDLVSLYNAATTFVMPSLYEGFGLPILEAMQSGCPVITTKEGSISEVVGEAAYYVDCDNYKSIASGISEVFENTKLQEKLSLSGLKQAKKFSWEKTAKQTVEAYKRVIASD